MEKINEILTLNLEPNEARLLWEVLKEDDFEESIEGFKSWVLYQLGIGTDDKRETPNNQFLETCVNYIEKNPQTIKTAGLIITTTLRKFLFKR